MTPIELFAVVTLAAFVALLGDRFIGAAIQLWGMRKATQQALRWLEKNPYIEKERDPWAWKNKRAN